MQNKLAYSLILAVTMVGTVVAPSYADEAFKSIAQFPLRVAGSAVGIVFGGPEGAVKDGVKGAKMSTKWVAGKLGDEDGQFQTWTGALVGGPVGIVGGAAYGMFDGGVHGFKTGYEKPFSKDSFTFKDE